jgi:hypothetical protein
MIGGSEVPSRPRGINLLLSRATIPSAPPSCTIAAMTLASDFWALLPYRLFGIAVLVFLVWAVWATLRSMRQTRNDNDWLDVLIDTESRRVREAAEPPGPPVQFTFHTCEGVLVYFVQKEFTLTLPAAIATAVVRGMHRRNLRKCLVPYPGIVYVPLLSWCELLKQRTRIRKQIAAARAAASHDSSLML